MKHTEIVELLPFYLNDTLEPAERAAVEREVRTCASCGAELRELTELRAALQAHSAAEPIGEASLTAMLARLDVPQERPARRPRGESGRPWWTYPVSYAAAFVLVFGGGAFAAELVHAYGAHHPSSPDGTDLSTTTISESGIMRVIPRTTLNMRVPRDADIDEAAALANVALTHGGATILPTINRGQLEADIPNRAARTAIAKLGELGNVHAITNDTVDIGSLIRNSEEYALTMHCAQQHLDAPNRRLCDDAANAYVADAALLKKTAAMTRLRINISAR